MRFLLWVLFVVIALQVNASSSQNLKATKTLESGSALLAQNNAQEKRYLRRADDKVVTAEEERGPVFNFDSLLNKNYGQMLEDLRKFKYTPSFSYLPYGQKIDAWLLLRALRKAFPSVEVDGKKWNTTKYFEYFMQQQLSPEMVRKKMGSGKLIDRLVKHYGMYYIQKR
ncbi:unnamed protein product [Peronospora effusa]|uniref:RxLR effector protein n=1 Tax=Peronospora effusa TaxID=542832 RepID=A0A3M6VDC2_9STRA|nr:hypothetical protein DD238_004560 [Peronospora effusa]RQM14155.1 hypothetical protein DD237_004839 [Peronospora effusa]CAI5716391.1 unnamed protein product [Peronospora effusa]